jgi:UDP-perosamine 4-acetyltransferase
MRSRLIIYGASGHGKVVADLIAQLPQWTLAGWIDDQPELKGRSIFGFPVLGNRAALGGLHRKGIRHAIVAIGDNAQRAAKASILREAGFRLATVVHPTAVVAESVRLGLDTVVMAGAVINAETIIGDHVIINTGSTVDHDCRIGDGVHIAPGAHLAGGVTVGEGALVGIGSCVIPGRSIGERAVVGAGAVVLSDIPAESVCVGTPARAIKSRVAVG